MPVNRHLPVWTARAGLLLTVGWIAGGTHPSAAQPILQPESPTEQTDTPSDSPDAADLGSTSQSAADLQIPARFGLGYNSSAGGYDGFGSYEGFIPLRQDPGKNLTFLNGRLLLDHDADPAGNLLLGHRFVETDIVLGGYAAYDVRSTGSSTFHRLGLGLDVFGDNWDAHLNGYLPIGDTRQLTASSSSLANTQITNSRFQDNRLLLSFDQQIQNIRQFEAAVGGFDIEAGARVLKLSEDRDVRVYGGLYRYDSAGASSFFGGRARVQAEPADNLTVGLGLQHDARFGTDVLLQVGFSFPVRGNRRGASDPVNNSPDNSSPSSNLLAQLGAPVTRTASIVVDQQTETDITIQSGTDVAAINPDTGLPYFFRHVVNGGAGTGTIDDPYGAIGDTNVMGTAIGDANANDIIYVRSGVNSNGFTIPDNVQVLSNVPIQTLPVEIQGTIASIQLPESGGNIARPDVLGLVQLGNNTTLSGFTITTSALDGIIGDNVSGTLKIDNNEITANDRAGISIRGDGNTTQTIIIEDNIVTNNTDAGMIIEALNNATTQTLTIRGNTVTNNGDLVNGQGEGIFLRAVDGATQNILLDIAGNNTVTGNGNDDIRIVP